MAADEDEHARPGRRRRLVAAVASEVERRIDDVRRRVDSDRVADELRIVPYIGHGTTAAVRVRGRVVDDPEPPEAVAGEGTLAAVRRTIARFDTDEVPGAVVRVRCGEADAVVTSDEEGYVDVVLTELGDVDVVDGWASASLELAAPVRRRLPDGSVTAVAPVRITDERDELGVISDVDDTVLVTGAERLADMLRTTLTGTALTRTPFAGVGELYRAFVAAGDPPRPVFYVSASPWNLHGFLTAFLAHREIPLGPLLLRDLGVDEVTFVRETQRAHKRDRIREVLELHPQLRFVLVGDSGELDPTIYAEVVEEFPGRIVAVWIREVRADPAAAGIGEVVRRFERAGVPFLLAADSDVAADHAVDLGLLTARDATEVHGAVVAERTGGESAGT